jgi:hypothetical protein
MIAKGNKSIVQLWHECQTISKKREIGQFLMRILLVSIYPNFILNIYVFHVCFVVMFLHSRETSSPQWSYSLGKQNVRDQSVSVI